MLKSLEILEYRAEEDFQKVEQSDSYLNKRGRSRKWKIRPGSPLCW